MFKVCIICSTLEAQGPTNVMYNMLEEHYKRNDNGIVFSIVTLSKEKPNSKIDLFRRLGIRIVCCELQGALSTLGNLGRVKKVIQSFSPDICHSYGLRADIVLSYIRFDKQVFKISSLWNNPFEDFRLFGALKGYVLARFLMYRYKRLDVVVTCSKHNQTSISRYGRKSFVIYTGVSHNHFAPISSVERELAKERLEIPRNKKVFIFIANLIERKNPLALIEAFNLANVKNAVLLIMGDGLLMQQCKDKAKNNPNIVFLGHQSTTLDYLRISDYYISTSKAEGFPTAVLEAMSVGVEPILSNIVPHQEMLSGIKDYPYEFFAFNDIVAIADAIKRASKEITQVNYREQIINNFTSEIMLEKYKSLYGLLLGYKIV